MNIKQKLESIIKEITHPILFKKYRKYQQKYGFLVIIILGKTL
jgi:hypothetical protein